MKIGIVFPQIEIGSDPDHVRRFATTAESLGFHHLLAYDHVLGANPASRPDWWGPYDVHSLFHEPFVLFSFLAGQTTRIEFATGVLILPQRQTALVAKQAASLDVLCGGRLRLGVGTGWNPVEYEALGENFRDRGRRSEEQIEVMRKLWAEPSVEFEGRWHTVPDAGILPRPVTGRIPVWLGGTAPAVIDRVGRLADGWLPMNVATLPEDLRRVREVAREHGRNPEEIGVNCILPPSATAELAREKIHELAEVGVTHVSFSMMKIGLDNPEAHIDSLGTLWNTVGDLSR